jgi:uncharacterized membrane protein YbhN (UPF0104 family)
MKQYRLRQVLSLAISVAFLAWAIHVLSVRWGELPAIHWSGVACAVVVISSFGAVLLNGAIGEQAARRVGALSPLRIWVCICFASTMLNYFLPLKAGSVFRLMVYARLSGKDVLGLAASFTMSAVLMQVVFALMLTLVLLNDHVAGPRAVLVLVAAFAGAAAVLVFARSRLPEWSLLQRLRMGVHAWAEAEDRFYSLIVLSLLALLLLLVTVVRYGAVGNMLQLDLGFSALIVIACASSLSALLGVTFGGLGIRDAAIVIAARLGGMSDTEALAFALIDRLFVSAVVLPAGLLCFAYLKRRLVGAMASEEGIVRR